MGIDRVPAYSMDRKTFAGSESDVFSKLCFGSAFDTEFVPVDLIPRVKDKSGKNGGSSYYRTVVCNNGYIFNASTLLMGGDYYNNPVNCLTSDQNTYYTAFPYLFYTLNSYSGSFLWFEVENQRFLTVKNSIAVSDLLEDQAGDRFPGIRERPDGLWFMGKIPWMSGALTVIRSPS